MARDSLIGKIMRRLYPTQKAEPAGENPLKLFNTLSGKKEIFIPLKTGKVSMYNCGPTVYNFVHIGNLRAFVFADTLQRVLSWNGYKVNQVINITDVGHLVSDDDEGEDKIELGARREGKTAKEIAKFYTNAFFEDLKALNFDGTKATFPKASEHIPEQITIVQTLEEKGYTYKTSDGIYFETSKFPQYGKLGRIEIEGLLEGARVAKNPEKRNPSDFALWKFSSRGDSGQAKREQEWESPWGIGFPGWHIECSAMSMKYLGKTFDIHTGGVDHIPIHHNNEIAQSECATGKPFVRYWLHNEHLRIEGRKISKSLGNTIFLNNITDRGISPLAFRYWLLTSHYKSPVNFTWEALDSGKTALFKLKRFFVEEAGNVKSRARNTLSPFREKFLAAINDDLDTPRALAIVWETVRDRGLSNEEKRAALLDFDEVLGLGLQTLDQEFWELNRVPIARDSLSPQVLKLLDERVAAREKKNWTEADKLRDEIKKLGFEVVDRETGPEVYRL